MGEAKMNRDVSVTLYNDGDFTYGDIIDSDTGLPFNNEQTIGMSYRFDYKGMTREQFLKEWPVDATPEQLVWYHKTFPQTHQGWTTGKKKGQSKMSDKAAEKQLCELVYSDSGRVGLGYEAGDFDINDMKFKPCASRGVSVQYGPHSHQTALACPKHRFVLDGLRREFPQ